MTKETFCVTGYGCRTTERPDGSVRDLPDVLNGVKSFHLEWFLVEKRVWKRKVNVNENTFSCPTMYLTTLYSYFCFLTNTFNTNHETFWFTFVYRFLLTV